MTKAKISEYDAVASNNTDVNGVNIAEGCPPSGMNNMGREIMAALKRFQVGSDGDGVTVGGNLVVSGSSTVNTFTAGPVSATTLNTSGAVVFNDAGADVDFRVEGDTDANLLFVDASADKVGIGTSSPTAKLHVKVATDENVRFAGGSGDTRITCLNDAASATVQLSIQGNPLLFRTAGGAECARITSGGYFKASDTGSYIGSSSGYHEFTNTVNNDALYVRASDASYTNTVLYPFATRSASSAYSIFKGGSGDGTDVEFNLRGDGNAYADGSWNGSGADYAEYFESAGETIPRGTTVVLDNNKVRAATENDPASSIIGVVRPKEFGKGSMVVGNLAWNMWTDKYLTDDFGVYEMEDHDVLEWEEQVLETEATEAVVDEEGNEVSPAQEAVYKTVNHSYESHAVPEGVTVPVDATRKTHDENGKKFQHRKLNPAWSADVEYTPREERPEWHIIGLLGQVPVLKGQPVGDRWIKMRDISETVEEWFIR